MSKLKLKPARFHVVKHRHKHFKLGTTIGYTDSLAATTTFTVTQKARGVVKGKRCVAPPRHPSKRGKKPKKCTRTVTFGTFTHRDKAGANRVAWNGKLKRRALKAGSYTLHAVAVAARRKSRARHRRLHRPSLTRPAARARPGYRSCRARCSSPSRSRSASWPRKPIVSSPPKIATASIDLRPCLSQ